MTKRLTKAENAVLEGHLARLRAETTAEGLEAAFQHDKFWMRYGTFTPSWRRIMLTLQDAGIAIVDAHPLGRWVPRSGPRGRVEVLGKPYRVGGGGNPTGLRYAWHSAGEWAMALYREEGLSIRASHAIWECSWRDYPHRALAVVERAVAGGIPDPEPGVLHKHERHGAGSPVRITVEENLADDYGRAMRPCPSCGGTLFDWGGGSSQGWYYLNWHCSRCPDVFTEYMTRAGFHAMRQAGSAWMPPANDEAAAATAA